MSHWHTRLAGRLGLIAALVFVAISTVLMITNGSVIFEHDFLERVGDQRLYHGLALGIVELEFPKSLYTVGYPLFLVPAVLLTGQQADWASIMPVVIPLQALVVVPVTMWLVFANKTGRYVLLVASALGAYILMLFLTSRDVLVGYNLLGLIPYSEPLAILMLVISYHVYLAAIRSEPDPGVWRLALLGACVAACLLTRNTLAILLLPIFVDMLTARRVRHLAGLSVFVGIFYLPQLIYNYLATGSAFFNGYAWWASEKIEKDRAYIERLYGIDSTAQFSVEYLRQNVTNLWSRYAPVVVLSALNLFKPNRFTVMVVAASMMNVVFYLAYWWSAAGGLIDRFLLPNVILLLYVLGNELVSSGAARGAHLASRP